MLARGAWTHQPVSKMKSTTPNPDNVVLLAEMPLEYQLRVKDRALEVTEEGITISDNRQPDNPIVYANLGFERLTGYSRDAALGENCRFLQGEDSQQEAIEEIRDAIREERSCSVEILNYRKDGAPFWNRLSITPILDTEGHATHFLGIQSDITERKEYERALQDVSARLEKKNQQMLQDLEDARQLQLSILPSQCPELPYMDIAVHMDTAQEVGGDYYDFSEQGDSFTFALGDATGHGLKAGTIVTATKMLFNAVAELDDPVTMLRTCSVSLKDIGFRNMYMAMMMARISKNEMTISSAGMPFAKVYRQCDDVIIDVALKGMPLGSFPDFPYESETLAIGEGDIFLFHSDGLDECFDRNGEMFGEPRIREMLYSCREMTPSGIIQHFKDATRNWTGGGQLRDDMTIVVMKRM